MIVKKGRIDTYTFNGSTVTALDLDLNAVILVEKDTGENEVKLATAGAPKSAVQGALVTIGPPQPLNNILLNEGKVEDGTIIGVMAEGVVGLIRKKGAGNQIGNRQAVQSVGDGKVGPLILSGTPTAEEQALMIGESCEIKAEKTDADDRLEVELFLER